jgi:glycosyltransferase involved in cell wall biosynthesis
VRDEGRRKPRVVVVAQAAPAQGGIATFAETIVADPELRRAFDMRLLNTTRKAVRIGGALSPANAWHALVDAVRVFRASRGAAVAHVQTALLPTLPLLRALAVCRAAHLAGTAVVCHAHTGLANAGPRETFEPTRLERFLLRRFGFVSRVVAVSRAGMNGLVPFMPGARFEVMDNAVDVGSFGAAHPGATIPAVLFVGTLARRKGLLDLLAAAQLLRARGTADWRLEVVGAGNEAGDREAETVRRAFADEGLVGALLGSLAGAALHARLRSASIYVLPSHSEGQPIGILEAMASGLPVVATRVGGIPEVIRDQVDGFLVDPGRPDQLADALASLIASPDLRSRMGESARRRAEDRYDVATLRSRLAEMYEQAARERWAR